MSLKTLGNQYSHLPLAFMTRQRVYCCQVRELRCRALTYFISNQQPPVQAKAVSTQQQSLEHTFQPILAGHSVDDSTLATMILTVPALDTFLYLDLYQSPKRRVALLQQRMLDVMQQPTSVTL